MACSGQSEGPQAGAAERSLGGVEIPVNCSVIKQTLGCNNESQGANIKIPAEDSH
jgi:hypothetical protein